MNSWGFVAASVHVTSDSFAYLHDQRFRNAFEVCVLCTCSFYLTSHVSRVFGLLQKRSFLNLKGGKKVQIFGFLETQKLDFLRKELSMEKIFLSQEAGMIRLSFDKKNFWSRQLRCRFWKFAVGLFFDRARYMFMHVQDDPEATWDVKVASLSRKLLQMTSTAFF